MVHQTTAIEVDMYGSPNYSYRGGHVLSMVHQTTAIEVDMYGSPNYSYRGGHVWFTKLQL